MIRHKVEAQPSKAIDIFGPGLCGWIWQRYSLFYARLGSRSINKTLLTYS